MWWGSNETVCRRAAKWKEMAHLRDLMKLDFMLRQDCVVAEHARWCCDRCATILKHMDWRGGDSVWPSGSSIIHFSLISRKDTADAADTSSTLSTTPNLLHFIIQLSHCTIKWSFFFTIKSYFFYNKMITVSQHNKLLCYYKKIDCSTINPTHNNVPDFFLTSSGSSTFLSGTYLTKLSTCDMDAS